MNDKITVYKINCSKSNIPYFGQSNNYLFRLGQHFRDLRKKSHSNKWLQFDYDKYGEDNFLHEIIQTGLSRAVANKVERDLIKNNDCYNNRKNAQKVVSTAKSGGQVIHLVVPFKLATPFENEAKDDDRSKASLFRRILEERYSK